MKAANLLNDKIGIEIPLLSLAEAAVPPYERLDSCVKVTDRLLARLTQ